jgi:hypothetical protein
MCFLFRNPNFQERQSFISNCSFIMEQISFPCWLPRSQHWKSINSTDFDFCSPLDTKEKWFFSPMLQFWIINRFKETDFSMPSPKHYHPSALILKPMKFKHYKFFEKAIYIFIYLIKVTLSFIFCDTVVLSNFLANLGFKWSIDVITDNFWAGNMTDQNWIVLNSRKSLIT